MLDGNFVRGTRDVCVCAWLVVVVVTGVWVVWVGAVSPSLTEFHPHQEQPDQHTAV
jgi:hypothetical protein